MTIRLYHVLCLSLASLGLLTVAGRPVDGQEVPSALKKILKKHDEPSPLDQFVEQAHKRAAANEAASPGSLYSGQAVWSNLSIDDRARSIDESSPSSSTNKPRPFPRA